MRSAYLTAGAIGAGLGLIGAVIAVNVICRLVPGFELIDWPFYVF